MSNALRTGDLRSLSRQERDRALVALMDEAAAPVNGRVLANKARIRSFELRYEMSSEQLLERLARNAYTETAEVSEWLFCLRIRDLSGG